MAERIELLSFEVRKTGNRAVVYAQEFDIQGEDGIPFWGITAQWDWTPSADDLRVWKKKFFPLACKKLARHRGIKNEQQVAVNAAAHLLHFNAEGDVVKEVALPRPGEVRHDSG